MPTGAKTVRELDWRAISQRFRLTRLALGITEEEAADAYGVTVRTYRKYEDGQPLRNDFLGFVEKYDVSVDWLIYGDTSRLGKHLSKLSGVKSRSLIRLQRRCGHERTDNSIRRAP
jgi:transcriptional regulator with XRE-family HTH domain